MNVPRLRFSGFNDNYILNTYDNVINIIDGDRGINYPKESDFYDDEYCLFLNAGNVTKNGFNFSNKSFITLKKDNELRNGKLRRNDVVLTTRGTVGNVALYDDSISFENIRINSGMVINRVKSNKLLPQYLYQFMQSSIFDFQVKKANFGSAQPQLTKKGIAKFNIAYPSIKEQRKVCSFLSLLDKKIELQTKRIETLKYFKKGLISKLLNEYNYKIMKIKDVLKFEQPTKYIVNSDEYINDSKAIPVLTANKAFILGYCNENNFYDKGDSIIFDDFTMDMKYTNFNYKVKSSAIKILTAKGNNDLRFLYELLLSLNLKSEEHKRHYISIVQELDVKIPSVEVQKSISSKLELVDNKILFEEKFLNNLTKLKKGFMQSMFV